MKKFILSIISVLLIAGFTNAQQKEANISFDKKIHDFGKINESDGKVEHKFVFTNTGSSPLIITNVKASCGCTSPTWTEKPVMPGQKGFVSAVFDPRNRSGNFNKSIFVETNTSKARNILRIVGEITPREKTVEDYYPKTIGALRLETNHFAFVKVYNDQIKRDTLKIYNSSDSKMLVSFKNIPSYLKLSVSSKELKPGEKAYILGEYNGEKANDWGFISARVKVLINGQSGNRDYITISAKIEEDFSKLTKAEKLNAPKIVFDKAIFNFGETKSKDKIEHSFAFKNEGKTDLIIHKIRTTCGCTTVAPEKTVIKPGESSSFKAIFNPGGRKGTQRKSIYVISNDPSNPNVRLMITGNLLDNKEVVK